MDNVEKITISICSLVSDSHKNSKFRTAALSYL